MATKLQDTTLESGSGPAPTGKDYRPVRMILVTLLLAAVAVFAWIYMHPAADKKRQKQAPVSVAKAQRQDVPLTMKGIGSITPANSVAIKPHTSGEILSTHFKEGQMVQAGQLLFSIDPRPLQSSLLQAQADLLNKQALVAQAKAAIAKDEALLNQAKANKDRDEAIHANAEEDAKRYAILSKQGAVSQSQYLQFLTSAISAKATVKADDALIGNGVATVNASKANLQSAKAQVAAAEAVVQNAKVQLSYTSITSPISGLAGNIQILNGNLVRQDTDVLVTVNQIHPIFVTMTVPEQQFAEVRAYTSNSSVVATVSNPTGGVLAEGGKLVFTNNMVDATTGTVMLKLAFENADQRLWPEFVNVLMKLTTIKNAIVVPSKSVQAGQKGSFVWVVSENNTVFMQPVTVGQATDGVTVITSGLAPGQTVVTDGQLQLAPKARVTISKFQGI